MDFETQKHSLYGSFFRFGISCRGRRKGFLPSIQNSLNMLYSSKLCARPFPGSGLARRPSSRHSPAFLQGGINTPPLAFSPPASGKKSPVPHRADVLLGRLSSYHTTFCPALRGKMIRPPSFCLFRGSTPGAFSAFSSFGSIPAQQGAAPQKGRRADFFFFLFPASALPAPPALSARRAFAPPDPSRWSDRRGAGR